MLSSLPFLERKKYQVSPEHIHDFAPECAPDKENIYFLITVQDVKK
jgi:tricorn protease-like protein